MKPPYAIGSVPSLSGHAIAYRWRSLPRVRRHRASKPQGSSERVLPWQITMDQLIFASLSHTHYWYEVGMLKVPAVCVCVVCVFFPFILDIKFVGRTSRGVTQEEGHTEFLIHLLSAVEMAIFHTTDRRWGISLIFYFRFFVFLREKSRLPGSNSRPNVSEGYEVPLSYRGDRS